jgi:hypothetical protein
MPRHTALSVIPIVLALSACSYTDEDYQWFEDVWISDAQRTITENLSRGVSQERIDNYAPLYGSLQWRVVGRTITFVHGSGYQHSSAFTLSREDDSGLRLVSNYGEEIVTVLEQTADGFCAQFNFDWMPDDIAVTTPPDTECFKRADS